ncbi:hypothetical protein ACFL6O_02115 [candidate division KSB1 bacterium]
MEVNTKPQKKEPAIEPLKGSDKIWSIVVGVFMLITGVLFLVLIYKLWPALVEENNNTFWQIKCSIFFWEDLTIKGEPCLMILVILASFLGSYVHIASSFVHYVGKCKFTAEWTWWYFLRMFIGASLALLFYFTLRGGLLTTSASNEFVNPFGIAGISGLVGLFSKQATEKLRELFDTFFKINNNVEKPDEEPE